VSRYTKAAPGGQCIVLYEGYQLCARCGNVHCADDRVAVVYRAPWWGIYAHLQGSDCPAKAVSGWRAVELAQATRRTRTGPAFGCKGKSNNPAAPFSRREVAGDVEHQLRHV